MTDNQPPKTGRKIVSFEADDARPGYVKITVNVERGNVQSMPWPVVNGLIPEIYAACEKASS